MIVHHLRHEDLHLSNQLAALVTTGRRAYVGRGLSDDQARENLLVLDTTGQDTDPAVRRLLRDSPDPLPPSYTVPAARRPRASVTSIVVSDRYRKLYLAVPVEDPAARPARYLSVYDLDEIGDPVPGTLRNYPVDQAAYTGGTGVEALALDSDHGTLYLTGGPRTALRYYRLDDAGLPVGAEPAVLPLPGAGRPALAVGADGTRLYLSSYPRRLDVLRAVDGVPQLDGLRTILSDNVDLDLGGNGYLRFVHTPRALYAVRSQAALFGTQRAAPVPLFALPLDAAGDPATDDWQRLDGFDHLQLGHTDDRLWLATETVAGPAGSPDGFELVAFDLGPDGLPAAEVERWPRRWAEQPMLIAAAAGTGTDTAARTDADRPVVVVSRQNPKSIDYVAGEQLRFRIRRDGVAGTAGPATYTCTVTAVGRTATTTFTVADGDLSAPVTLDPYLTGAPVQMTVSLRFAPATAGARFTVEAHYTPDGAGAGTEPSVRTTTVRGQTALFLLPGYAQPPDDEPLGASRTALFEEFAEHWQRYRDAAASVALADDERPDQFVVSGYSIVGGQAHDDQLGHGIAALHDLGINSVQLAGWQGIPPAELADRTSGLSPESGVYAPPLYSPFAFVYDGSLTETATGHPIDGLYLQKWAQKQADAVPASTGKAASQVVRFQLADEPGWYFPEVLRLFDLDDPRTPTDQPVRWTDPEQRNSTWIRRFQDYVAANDPDLVAEFGADWARQVPVGRSAATTRPLRRLHYWSLRFLSDQATDGVARLSDELQTAFKAQHAPDPRPEHNRLHIHLNFGETLDWQWHKPYPDLAGDKNPDVGPDSATGGYDWFRLGSIGSVLPSKHTYLPDSHAQAWSFYSDLLRSAATTLDATEPPSFTAFVPGSRIGALPHGAAYKLGSVLARGAKMVTAYAFGPELLFLPPNGWGDRLAAYPPVADALRLAGRAQRVLYPGRPATAKIAIHLPAGSRIWDEQQISPWYVREVLPLHTALTHDGYQVDLVDDNVSFNDSDYVADIFGILTGAYVFSDSNGAANTSPGACVNAPLDDPCWAARYHWSQIDQNGGFALWSLLSGYSVPAPIHDFMLNKHGGYFARIQSRFGQSSYPLPTASFGPLGIDPPDPPPARPRYFQRVSDGTTAPADYDVAGPARFKPVPQSYFAAPTYLNSAGGRASSFYDIGKFSELLPVPPITPDLLLWKLLLRWLDSAAAKSKQLHDVDAFSRPSTIIPRGNLRIFHRDDIDAVERLLPTMRGRDEFQLSQNLATYKNVSVGYTFDPDDDDRHLDRPQRYPRDWDEHRVERVGSGRAAFEVFDFTDVPEHALGGHYWIIASFSKSANEGQFRNYGRGLWEVVPGHRFATAADLAAHLVESNPADHFTNDTDDHYRYTTATTGETLTIDNRLGSSATDQAIIGITGADGEPIPLTAYTFDVRDEGALRGIPLLDAWQVDRDYGFTGLRYAYSDGRGRVAIYNPFLGQALHLDSSDYRTPDRIGSAPAHAVELPAITGADGQEPNVSALALTDRWIFATHYAVPAQFEPSVLPGELVAYDRRTLEPGGRVTVGRSPHTVGLHEASNRLFVLNYEDSSMSVVDAGPFTVAATLDFTPGWGLNGMSISQRFNRVFATQWGQQRILVIDAVSLEQLAPMSGLTISGDIVLDEPTDRLFVLVTNAADPTRQDLVEFGITAAGQTELRRCTINGQVSRAAELAVDAERCYVLTTATPQQDVVGQQLTIVDRSSFTVVGSVPLAHGGLAVAASASQRAVYVASEYGVQVVDTTSRQVLRTIDLPYAPKRVLAMDERTGAAYYGGNRSATLTLVGAPLEDIG